MKNYYKKTAGVLLLGFILQALPAAAQSNTSFTAGFSKVYSTFRFLDNGDNGMDSFSKEGSGGYNLGYQHRFKGGPFLHFTGGIRNANVSMDFEGLQVDWALQYADADLFVGYMLTKKRIQPFLSAGPYFAFLLKGDQSMAGIKYDVLKSNTFSQTDYGVKIKPGVKFVLSELISLYAEGQYLLGLSDIEKAGDQKTRNRGFALTFGVSLDITKFQKTIISAPLPDSQPANSK